MSGDRLNIKYEIGVVKNTRYLDGTWKFEYVTEANDPEGADWTTTVAGATPTQAELDNISVNKDIYPEDTVYLEPGQDIIYNTTTIENVYIDSLGPTLYSDNTNRDAVGKPFVFKFKFSSKIDLDVRELEIKNGTTDIFIVHRKNSKLYSINDLLSDKSKLILTDLELSKNDTEYELTFKLDTTVNQSIFNVDMLNDNDIQVKVYDLAGNGLEYDCSGTWHYVGAEYDANNLVPVVITFPEYNPYDKILDYNIEGEVLVQIYNPNQDFRDLVDEIGHEGDIPDWYTLPLEFELDDQSVGVIDRSTIDWTDYKYNGIVVFRVKGIKNKGSVIVNAWIAIDNDEKKNEVKNATYATGTFGPFILQDPKGRKYKFEQYVPKFLRDQEYYDFVYFTQKFLNTMYSSLDKRYNISVLEKIARIGNFNSIDDIEKELIEHYKKQFAIEVYPNIDEVQSFLLQKRVTTTSTDGSTSTSYAFGDMSEDELYDFIKYVYKEIPDYNQYKGTFKGVKMIINMLGMCCKLVELWGKIDGESKSEYVDYRRADEINDYPLSYNNSGDAVLAKYYLSSRFDVDLEEPSLAFSEFNDLSDNIVRIILQVKPVTRLLRKLSYIYTMWTDIHFSYMWFPWTHVQQLHHFNYTYNLTHPYEKRYFPFDYVGYTLPKVFIPYVAEKASVKFYTLVDHEWKEGSHTSGGDQVTRQASKNTYYNLHNIAQKVKVSNLRYLTFKWSCEYRVTGNKDGVAYTMDSFDTTTDQLTLPVFNEALGDNISTFNGVQLIQDEGGFWLKFLGSSNSLFRRMINNIASGWKNKTLNLKDTSGNTVSVTVDMSDKLEGNELPSEEVIKNRGLICSDTQNGYVISIYFNAIKFDIQFDIPLGTSYICQLNNSLDSAKHVNEKYLAYLAKGATETVKKRSRKKS